MHTTTKMFNVLVKQFSFFENYSILEKYNNFNWKSEIHFWFVMYQHGSIVYYTYCSDIPVCSVREKYLYIVEHESYYMAEFGFDGNVENENGIWRKACGRDRERENGKKGEGKTGEEEKRISLTS